MRVYRFINTRSKRGSTGFSQRTCPRLVPVRARVLVRVHAVSLNNKDLYIAKGMSPRGQVELLIPLSDAAGEVIETGPGVDPVSVGDRVVGLVAPKWIGGGLTKEIAQSVLGTTINGVLAEYVVMGQEAVLRFPPHLNYEGAATLPCAAATAWTARNLRA